MSGSTHIIVSHIEVHGIAIVPGSVVVRWG